MSKRYDTYLVKRCKILINEMIKKSFPELEKREIQIYESDKISFSADTYSLFFFSRIRLNPKIASCTNFQIKGLLAHELCHMVKFIERGSLKNECYILLGNSFASYKKKEEMSTDIEAIKRGLGRELLANRVWRAKNKDKNYYNFKDWYLAPKEIKRYITNKLIK